ncbi:MAG TPA: DUF1800 domain-containing protein [Candidatus Acidoferrales bacterium]
MKLRPSSFSFACAWNARVTAALMAALLAFTPVAVPAAAAPAPAAADPIIEAWKGRLPISELSEDEAILHALNRLAYGPRPGDLERVRAMGLEKWIEQQLHPDAIDDSALARRVERFPTVAMSSAELLEGFPNPAVAAARAGMTQEEYRRTLQERQRAARNDMQGQRRQNPGDPMARMGEMRNPQRIVAELGMAKLTRAVYSERQLHEVLVDFWFNHFNVFANKGADRWLVTSYERDVIRPHTLGKFRDMLGATAKSPAMLFYLDNWMSADPAAAERLERQFNERRNRLNNLFGMRNPRQMGERMDRQQQRRPGQQRPGQNPANRDMNGQPMPQRPPQRLRRGLNENYARELLELHTLGVDGGYTQQDVIEVARAFTGWTMQAPRRYPEFFFDSRFHDAKSKTVLGKKVEAGGMRDGEMILDLLSRHPHTAKFISTKLARRFVADEPPAALVEKMSQAFLKSDGDITATVRTMIYSPEFWARSAYRSKIKKPFELVASAVRALDGDAIVPLPLVQWSARIGEPLYLCQPPTGYSDKAEAWVNTGALLNRLNFALQLASGRMRGVQVRTAQLLGGADEPSELMDRAVEVFLAGQVSPETRAVLARQMSDPEMLRSALADSAAGVDAGVVAGLVLGTPEFQRR